MRIRKRPVQLPPLSPRTAASGGSELPPEPSDHRLSLISKWVSFDAAAGSLPDKEADTPQINVVELEEKEEHKTRSSNDSRKGNILVAEAAGSGLKLSIPNFFVQGERAFPLKKRRGSFGDEETRMMVKGKIADMKTKMNKKCAGNNSDEVALGLGGAEDNTMGRKQKGKLKRGRGNLIMEGSRCSRVNGRGWRCCQQTLVGYSLCEHHLGKGRIRNITSVKGRGIAVAPENENIISLDEEEKEERKGDNAVGNGENEVKPLRTTSKKKASKMGMVKARSLSSLLGQADGGSGVQQYAEAESERDKEIL